VKAIRYVIVIKHREVKKMKIAKRAKKVIQLLFLFGLITVLSPFILAKLNFYGPSHAAAATTISTATNTAIPSVSLNAPVSYADAVALAAPAVVSIKTTQEITVEQNPLFQDPMFRYFFGDPNAGQGNGDWGGQERGRPNEPPKETLQGLGSGVIVSNKGYVLTNNHVIREADTVVVTLADGRTADGKVVGTDPDSDLAVLQIKLDKLPVITLGSSQKLRVGDVVLAIGNPYGLDKTVTQGIVSATERPGIDIGIFENLIQTDAAINPGNSGGGLIDAFGRIIGINTAIYTRSGGHQGIGFAIPIDQAIEVMNKLIEGKPIIRGYLGIMMQPLNKEIRSYINYNEGEGAYVRAVVRDSPAQKAGLLPGDVIIKINNTVITDERMALRLVAGLTPGQNYPVEIFRKGEYMSFIVMPSERKQSQPKRKEKE
jgi:serine protease DegS